MVDEIVVQVWTLATEHVTVPPMPGGQAMTQERLAELRVVLAAMADTPIATLEAHPLPTEVDRSRGISLGAASPLAIHLSQLIRETTNIASSGETLYRMVVPAKFAAQVGGGLLESMTSTTGTGVYSALKGASGIAGHARFVPVAGAGVVTIAAPLMLAAVAAGISMHAEHKRERAIANITRLLEKLHADALTRERTDLNACQSAIQMASAILLDGSEIGHSLGLGPAVQRIAEGLELARDRVTKWQRALDQWGDRPVEISALRKKFGGIDREGGEFRAHLELADLAIALKKRVIVLQAVEHAEKNPSKLLERFVARLKADQEDVIKLESELADVRRRLGRLQLDRGHGVGAIYMHMGDVDHLLRASRRLRELGDGIETSDRQPDVAVEIARNSDGSVVVFPALTA